MELRDSPSCPQARSEGLVVESIDDELLIYDESARRAHCLNRSAALVWKYCDGKTPAASMAAQLAADMGGAVDEEVVWFALRQLGERGLLAQPVNTPGATAMSRRQLLARLGAAAALVPLVTSLVAPTSAAAQSGGSSGSTSSGSSGSTSSSGAS